MKTIALAAVLLLASCGGGGSSTPLRSYSLTLRTDDSSDRYRYIAAESPDIRVGDEVTFELDNTGTLIHDLRVIDPDGTTVAILEPIAPGDSATLTVRFDRAGFFSLNCVVDDHLIAHQMQTFVEVTDPGA